MRVGAKPHLKAELVARMHVDGERDIEYVMKHYGLTRAQVHAALAYYYENPQTLDEADERSWRDCKTIKSEDLRSKIEKRMPDSN